MCRRGTQPHQGGDGQVRRGVWRAFASCVLEQHPGAQGKPWLGDRRGLARQALRTHRTVRIHDLGDGVRPVIFAVSVVGAVVGAVVVVVDQKPLPFCRLRLHRGGGGGGLRPNFRARDPNQVERGAALPSAVCRWHVSAPSPASQL
eukprot:SAG22_NODE_1987_length_3201_cov_12.979046_4_plen_146_part_00